MRSPKQLKNDIKLKKQFLRAHLVGDYKYSKKYVRSVKSISKLQFISQKSQVKREYKIVNKISPLKLKIGKIKNIVELRKLKSYLKNKITAPERIVATKLRNTSFVYINKILSKINIDIDKVYELYERLDEIGDNLHPTKKINNYISDIRDKIISDYKAGNLSKSSLRDAVKYATDNIKLNFSRTSTLLDELLEILEIG